MLWFQTRRAGLHPGELLREERQLGLFNETAGKGLLAVPATRSAAGMTRLIPVRKPDTPLPFKGDGVKNQRLTPSPRPSPAREREFPDKLPVHLSESLHLVVTLSPSCLRIDSAKGLVSKTGDASLRSA
jgi:hypothetical protein